MGQLKPRHEAAATAAESLSGTACFVELRQRCATARPVAPTSEPNADLKVLEQLSGSYTISRRCLQAEGRQVSSHILI